MVRGYYYTAGTAADDGATTAADDAGEMAEGTRTRLMVERDFGGGGGDVVVVSFVVCVSVVVVVFETVEGRR